MKKAAVPSILVVVVQLAVGVIAEAQQLKEGPTDRVSQPLLSFSFGTGRRISARVARAWVRGREKHCY